MDDVVVSPATVRSLGDLLIAVEWWRKALVSFLPVKDLVAFSAASRMTYSVRSVPVPCAHRGGQWEGPWDQGVARFWQQVALPAGALCVKLRFHWVDQGWGNHKGTLALVREGGTLGPDYSEPTADVLALLQYAEHHLTTGELQLHHPRCDIAAPYHFDIWLRVGGGGGHRLDIHDLEIMALVAVDPKDVVWAATSDTVTADNPIAEPMAAASLAVDADEVVAEAPGRVAAQGPPQTRGPFPSDAP